MERIEYPRVNRLYTFDNYGGEFRFVGKIGRTLEVWVDDEGLAYKNFKVVMPRDRGPAKVACEIELSMSRGSKGASWSVDLTKVDSKFQGFGIAVKAYAFIIKKMGIVLQAGSMQSPGGRSIWAQLAKENSVMVYGMKGRNGDLQVMVPNEDGTEVECEDENVQAYDVNGFNMFAVKVA